MKTGESLSRGEGPAGRTGSAAPGRWLRRLTVGHAALGVFIYRPELREIGSRGIVGAVPYRSKRAAALWFIGAALPGWLVGRLVDVAAEAGDADAVGRAAMLGLVGGLGGAALMPVSPLWIQALVCGQMLREARRLGRPDSLAPPRPAGECCRGRRAD